MESSQTAPNVPTFPARDAPVSRHLCEVVRDPLRIGRGQVPRLRLPGGDLSYFGFLGSFAGSLMASALALSGIKGPLRYTTRDALNGADFAVSREALEAAARRTGSDLERFLDPGAATFHRLVADESRPEYVAQSALCSRLWEWSQALEIVEPDRQLGKNLHRLL